jgi:hypothetical protein
MLPFVYPNDSAHADTDPSVRAIKVLLNRSTPEWRDWREAHVQALPDLQAHAVDLERKRAGASAAERWVSGNHLRYVQRPLHYLGKDMLDALKPGGPLPEQHAAEMEFLEHRGARRPVPGLWVAAGGGAGAPADTLLDLILAGASFELCVRRLTLHVMLRGALTDAQLADAFGALLDAFGHEHTATLTNLEAAGLLTARPGGRAAATDTDSAGAAVRTLLDRAESNQRGQKNSLTLSAIVVPVPGDGDGDAAVAAASQSPYGRYRPVSTLLVRSAMRRYMPDWAKVRSTCVAMCKPDSGDEPIFKGNMLNNVCNVSVFISRKRRSLWTQHLLCLPAITVQVRCKRRCTSPAHEKHCMACAGRDSTSAPRRSICRTARGVRVSRPRRATCLARTSSPSRATAASSCLSGKTTRRRWARAPPTRRVRTLAVFSGSAVEQEVT